MSTIVTRSGKGVPLTATDHDNNVNNLNTDKVETLADLSITSTATEINLLDGVTATTAELNYVDGVTSNIQTQLGTKLPLAGGTMTGTIAGFTSTGIDDNATSTAITIDASEQVGIGTASPAGLLHISGSTTTTLPSIVIERTGSGSSKWDIKPYADTLTFRADATTDRLTLTNDGRGLSQFTAKAWVNFNGTGTVAIRDSHNVSSITDMNTGSYLVNFANNMANTLYCPLASSSQGASASTNYNNHVCVQNITTNSRYQLLMRPQATSDTMVDIAYIYSVVFGD